MSLPSVTRKTEKGIPRYDDQAESDVFLLSGYEDLVPVLAADGTRLEDKSTAPGYTIHRYRPRIEGLFSRIERWTRDDGDIHWRSISRDNILTLYGEDSNSRIADPDDPKRIFKWLLCQSRDDKGNALLYEYKTDDGAGVDILQAHERNRGAADDPRRRTNRHIKRIFYGNRVSLLDDQGKRPRFVNATHFGRADWMFEVVFDYGEHDGESPEPGEDRDWLFRDDPFSVYRAGFEVRTTRLCQRVLMFHHFASEPEVGANCLVRSTDFTYAHEQNPNHERNPVYTFLRAVTHAGYRRQGSQYLKQSLPPVEFEYSLPVVQQAVEDIDPDSLENLPIGVDGAGYRWIDLHGEGIPGILTEQATGWYYKRNLSPINNGRVAFTAVERVPVKPNLALAAGAQLVDLAGDGQLDLVTHELTPGFFEHDGDRGWLPFRPFSARLNRDMREPNLRLIDLNGDGHADLLITEDDTFVWHASLAEAGFGPAQQVARALDEETGPRIVFADGTESIYLADMSGDGLTDIVRIRNGEVCYWPNLGYARFGVKVTMDQSPVFDNPDQFEHNRLQLADIDGTGTVDLIYLHRDGVRLFYNQSGNSWSTPSFLSPFPDIDEVTRISATDLLGNGTACLVWSSPLQRDARRRMRFVNLMGDQKPHLLIKMVNNLGAETHVHYASSTKFYLTDERGGKPWITRLPFPVHVVERVDIYDCISRNRFMTRYAYHHGYFDGEEREFRGFGMVEQWDAEEIGALSDDGAMSEATNLDAESNLPPVHTKSWFHTGVYVRRASVSRHYSNEYYREPALSDQALEAQLLPDTVLPRGLTLEEEVEACRALKGMMLRQEVYADDAAPGASPAAIERARTPYSVVEQNFTVKLVQGRGDNHHGVFFTHPREAITYHYERNPQDPRVQHALTLEVDVFGNVLQGITIGYGRRQADPALPLLVDRDKQTQSLVTYSSSGFTNATDAPDAYRTPLPCESQTYELTGFRPAGNAVRFSFDEWARNNFALLASAAEIAYEQEATGTAKQRRLIEHQRSLFRDDDLTRLLPLGESGSLGLTGESYQLAFTPGLLSQVYQREGQPLLASPSTVLGGQGADSGGYVTSDDQKTGGLFPDSDPDNHWWVPGGRSFLSADSNANAAQERHYARTHFFLPQRYRDAFGQTTTVTYDDYDLLLVETRDPVGNRVTVGSRDPAGNLLAHGNDYRVLQPRLVMDPNRNRTEVAFDTLGMVVGTAIMGKPEEDLGDSLQGFQADLSEIQLVEQLTQPLADPQAVLGRATSRLIYDLFAYQRSQDQPQPEPAVVQTLARETHVAQLGPGESTKVQLSLSYSDGFGREIQHKIRAESETIDGVTGPPRWVGSGWTIFNNKGKPVRQYEPFFSATHGFEFGVVVGVSAVVFYDPLQRVIVTLHPNCSYEKVRFDPWQQISWDVNDTVLSDPRTDPDIAAHVATYFTAQPAWETWYAQRQGGALGTKEQEAALKAAAHADTPARSYFDVLGRPFMSMAHNKVKASNHELNGADEKLCSRIALDIEGNQREVRDAVQQNGDAAGRIVMRYAYDMLGNQIYQLSMEAGARWALNDVTGALIRSWDSRGHITRAAYDPLRRPIRTHVLGADPTNAANELLTDRLVYGEQHPEAEVRNLRGAVYLQLDQAGAVTTEVKDFKGNVLQSSRRIAREYKRSINWQTVESVVPATASLDVAALEASLAVYLEFETYTGGTEYDALNRPILLRTPHTPSRSPSIIRPTYNVAGLLERVDAVLRGETANGQPVWTAFVTNVDYDAKGQRQRVEYGNGVSTFYGYDRDTFRLVHLLTKRNSVVFPEDCPAAPPNSWPGCHIQNLHYTYDPAGNITHIHDTAQQTIFFRNKRVEPSNDYTYDALYRLIEATGREHLSQYSTPIPHSHNDAGRVNLLSADGVGRFAPNDGNAMGRYVERYVYDAVGNFLKMNHRGTDPAHAGWTRAYSYAEDSLIESNKKSNRLSQTTLGAGNTGGEPYTHDAHGNMTQMNHLPLMRWNYRDQLQATARHVVDDNVGTPETTYYVYDSTGQRMRKVTERQAAAGQAPTRKKERIYLGGFEIFRKFGTNGSAVSAGARDAACDG